MASVARNMVASVTGTPSLSITFFFLSFFRQVLDLNPSQGNCIWSAVHWFVFLASCFLLKVVEQHLLQHHCFWRHPQSFGFGFRFGSCCWIDVDDTLHSQLPKWASQHLLWGPTPRLPSARRAATCALPLRFPHDTSRHLAPVSRASVTPGAAAARPRLSSS